MGTEFVICPKCYERSRNSRGWYCPHCDWRKPNELGHIVRPLTARDTYVQPKPRKVNAKVAAKAERKAEKAQLAEDIAKIDRSKLPELRLRLKSGLRLLQK